MDEIPGSLEFEGGGENVWADLGEPDATELFARAQVMHQLTAILRERGLTQVQAAELLGTTQPVVSDLMRGKLSKFSIERLFGYLEALGYDVEIVVRKRAEPSRRQTRLRAAG